MKKLMIAAAIVCAAAVSQAASYNWTGKDVYQCWDSEESENYAGGTAYLFVQGVNGITTFDALYAAIEEGKFVSDNWALKAADTPLALGVNTGAFGVKTYETDTDLEGSKFLAVVIADKYWDEDGNLVTLDPAKELYATYSKEVTAGEQPALGGFDIKFGSLDNSYAPDGWFNQASAVPEPTSGLLLLLGVAGLALRRRRA